jgi:hypothetical protein
MKMLKKEVIIFGVVLLSLITLVYATPLMEFISPTFSNATYTTNESVEINISITEANLNELIYNWNGTNFTMYDDSLVLMMNFDNINELNSADNLWDDSLVSYWSFNNGSAADGKGGNNGTVTSAVIDTFGKFDDGFEFDGINDRINITSDTSINFSISDDFTFSFWAKPKKIDGTWDSVFTKSRETSVFFGVYISDSANSNKWNFGSVSPSISENFATPSGAGQWDFITVVQDTSAGKLFFYQNGAPASILPSYSNTVSWEGTGDLIIGGSGIAGEFFNGTVDEVAIWNRSLSASEVLELYNKGFTEDNSNYGNNGTILSTTNTTGKYSGGLSFDGIDDYINISDDNSLDISSAITLGAWIKFNSFTNSWGRIVAKDDNDNAPEYGIIDGDSNYVRATMHNAGGTEIAANTASLSTDTWYYIAFTYDTTNGLVLYTDGVAGNTAAANGNIRTSSESLLIGSAGDGANLFNGTMDEIRIWNRSLSANEIYQQYVSNLNKFNSTQWYFYVNQSQNLTTGLANGTYTTQIFATDISSNTNQTELRTINIGTEPVVETPVITSCGDGTCDSDETCSSCSSDCGSCGGGGGSYLRELNGDLTNLKFRTHLPPGKSKVIEIKSDKETDLIEVEIKAKNWLTGEIEIIPYIEVPESCLINYEGDYKFYKALDVDSTFNGSLIGEARLRMGVLKDWIYENNISEIKAVKCEPYYQELKISYVNETNESGIYDIYSNGFSTLAILGTLPLSGDLESGGDEKIWTQESKGSSIWKILLLVILVLIIIGIIILLIKHRIYLKEKIHTKFFDFEFKFRIGKK